jgi:hypothetical protein
VAPLLALLLCWQPAQASDEVLSYNTAHQWRWYDRDQGIQYTPDALGLPALRKVYPGRGHEVRLVIDSAGDYVGIAYWRSACDPGSIIETGQRYQNGLPIRLYCNDQGDHFFIGATISRSGKPPRWRAQFGSFQVDEDFRHWDVSILENPGSPMSR